MKLTKNLTYFIKDAINGIKQNKDTSASSIIIVMSSLCLFCVYILLSLNMTYIISQFGGQYKISAYIEKGTPDSRIEEIKAEIEEIDTVKTCDFVSEDDALKEFEELFDNNTTIMQGLDAENPLRASFRITPYNLADSQKISLELENIIDVVWVKNNQEIVTKLIDAISFFKRGCMLIMIVFGMISVGIIANTIKISVITRKNDIFTMRYLGASNDFIIYPFIIEGIIIGIAATIPAFLLVVVSYSYCVMGIEQHLTSIIKMYSVSRAAIPTFLYCLCFGIILSTAGSLYAVKKYIKV